MNYLFHLLVYFNIYLIVAMSLNLVVGYCGMLTLAHAGFYAVGGYTYALLSLNAGWGFVPAALAGAGVAAGLSLFVSVSAWRLKGDFFVMVTLAAQALIYSLLYNWHAPGAELGSLRNLTNGPFGITGIPRASLFGMGFKGPLAMAIFSGGIAAVCVWVLRRLKSSPWARLLTAMREDELAARGLGKNTRMAKVQAFAISAGFAAIAGALYAAHVRYLDPSSASLDESILMLSMVMVGGLGNLKGPAVGAAVLILLPEALRFLNLPDAQAANLRLMIYGLLLVAIVHFRPQGLAGTYRLE
jgi:branched-chain amino acid transport system permease protein